MTLATTGAVKKDHGTASAHRAGPAGLDSWTLKYGVPDLNQGPLPGTLVVARNGRVVRRIEGDPFVWRWVFLDGGQQIAYETGPLHFGMSCVLLDLASGKRMADFDCYHDLPAGAPAWVSALENSPDAP
jgi:hypothetical protein